jgi:hypothetical protein
MNLKKLMNEREFPVVYVLFGRLSGNLELVVTSVIFLVVCDINELEDTLYLYTTYSTGRNFNFFSGWFDR